MLVFCFSFISEYFHSNPHCGLNVSNATRVTVVAFFFTEPYRRGCLWKTHYQISRTHYQESLWFWDACHRVCLLWTVCVNRGVLFVLFILLEVENQALSKNSWNIMSQNRSHLIPKYKRRNCVLLCENMLMT